MSDTPTLDNDSYPTSPTTHFDGTGCTIVACADCGDTERCDCDMSRCETCSRRLCDDCCGTDLENGCSYCWPCSRAFLREVIAGLHDDEMTMTPAEAERELAGLIESYGDDV